MLLRQVIILSLLIAVFSPLQCSSESFRAGHEALEPLPDDGYFDPFNYDWGIVTHNASETVRLRLEYQSRRKMLNSKGFLTCEDKKCRAACGSDEAVEDDEAGPCGVTPEQCPCCVRCDDSPDTNPRCGAFANAWGQGGVTMEDKYLPALKKFSGSCLNIEDRIARLEMSIFGQGRTFRDSELCRKMALEYICAFWGSQNAMYDNRCVGIQQSVEPALQPCRSMCVQLAITCANNPDYKDLCRNLPCEDDATIPGVDCEPGNNFQIISDKEKCLIFDYADLALENAAFQISVKFAIWVSMASAIIFTYI